MTTKLSIAKLVALEAELKERLSALQLEIRSRAGEIDEPVPEPEPEPEPVKTQPTPPGHDR
jgi:hypothetical protein